MRKWLDILREFSVSDFGGGGGDGDRAVLVYDIVWDTETDDGAYRSEDAGLPDHCIVRIEGDSDDPVEIEDEINHEMGHMFSWLTQGYQWKFI